MLLASAVRLPSWSTTQSEVSSIETSSPTKYSMAVLRWRLGRESDPESAPPFWGTAAPRAAIAAYSRLKPNYADNRSHRSVGDLGLALRSPSPNCDRTKPRQSIAAADSARV